MLRRLIAFLAALALAAPAQALTPGQTAVVLSNPCVGIVLSANYAGSGACYNGSPKPSFTAIPGYSFTRASLETCTDLSGLITYAANNVPCVNSAGYAAWQAATNLALQSAFAASWSVQATVLTANSSVAPDGTATAALLTEQNTTNVHNIFQGISVSSGQTYTLTVYAKAGTNRYVTLDEDVTTNSWYAAVYDLQGGGSVATQTGAGSTSGAVASTSQVCYSSGWCRLTLTGSVAGNYNSIVGHAPAATGNTFTTTGQISYTASSALTLSIWGAQLELSAFPTPYIPTTTASATRAADDPQINNSALAAFFNQGGSAYVEWSDPIGAQTTNRYLWRYRQAGAQYVETRINATGKIEATVANSGSTVVAGANTLGAGIGKAATRFAVQDLAVTSSVESVPATGADPALPAAGGIFYLGSSLASLQINGTIRKIIFTTQRWPNAKLQSLTH